MNEYISPYDNIRKLDRCGWKVVIECYGVKRKFLETNKRFRKRVIENMKKLYPLYVFDE